MIRNMRSIIVLIAAAAVILIGFFLFNHYIYTENQSGSEAPVVPVEVVLEGTVRSVDLDAMAADGPGKITFTVAGGETYTVAVPSMGLPLCAAPDAIASVSDIRVGDTVRVAGELNEAGEIVPCASESHYLAAERRYVDSTANFSFTYRVGPNGFTLVQDVPSTDSVLGDATSGVMLMETSDAVSMGDRESSEGPPTINVRVYDNADLLTPMAWAEEHQFESNLAIAANDPVETTLADAPAVRYMVDGLYLTDTIIATANEQLFVLTGSRLDEYSPLISAFEMLVETFSFSVVQPN